MPGTSIAALVLLGLTLASGSHSPAAQTKRSSQQAAKPATKPTPSAKRQVVAPQRAAQPSQQMAPPSQRVMPKRTQLALAAAPSTSAIAYPKAHHCEVAFEDSLTVVSGPVRADVLSCVAEARGARHVEVAGMVPMDFSSQQADLAAQRAMAVKALLADKGVIAVALLKTPMDARLDQSDAVPEVLVQVY